MRNRHKLPASLRGQTGGQTGPVGAPTVDVIASAVRDAGPHALVALDFDGTLAPIVADPEQSRPLPGTLEALRALAGIGVRLAVVTGRDAATVVRLGGLDTVPGLVVAGLYGAETWRAGRVESPPTPDAVTALRARLPALVAGCNARRGDDALWVEDKRLSLVVHGRRADKPEAALDPLREPVAALAGELGLETHAGRGVIEIRLPGFDKAAALRRLVDETQPRVVVFVGDDRGDVPALLAVRELRTEDRIGFGVGAGSAEFADLADVADVVVDGPTGVLDLLRLMARGAASPTV